MGEWKEKDAESLRRICRIGHIVLIIGIVVMAIVAAVSLAGAVLDMADHGSGHGDVPKLVAGAVGSVFVLVVLMVLDRVVRDISLGGTPFTYENADRLKLMAILFAIGTIAVIACHAGLSLVLDVPIGDASIDLGSLVTAAIVYVISLIFRYGTKLQIESDNTV
jgi:uncharacterized membrane protein